jgi:hypothetical protein
VYVLQTAQGLVIVEKGEELIIRLHERANEFTSSQLEERRARPCSVCRAVHPTL